MDTQSDETIFFDDKGQCNYCTKALSEMGIHYFPGATGAPKLESLLTEMRQAGKGKKYDCIMGLSGGLDSSYLAYLGFQWGLRVLAVHIDDGFDSDVSKRNIENLVTATGFDYLTIDPDPAQFSDLTRSYMLAGVPNIAVPQDNVLFAFLYQKAKEHGIKHFASGGNYALESILQKGNTYTALDVVNLKDIHRRFGEGPINRLKFISKTETTINTSILGLKTVRPLNLVEYNQTRAFAELKEFSDFQYYGRKHLENRLTEFIQLYWFFHKFGVDKRTSHLSSMIVSGQMTREQALTDLSQPIYTEDQMDSCITFVCAKLGIKEPEFNAIMQSPTNPHESYLTQDETIGYKISRRFFRLLGRSGFVRRSGNNLKALLK